jgi:hypothetical protein
MEGEVTHRLDALMYAFVNRDTETTAKVVSIGTRRERP